MAEVETARALLLMALTDLLDSQAALAERLPVVLANASDAAFKRVIAEDRDRSAGRRGDLDRMIRDLGGDPEAGPCIWMRAVLDDADNDAATIAQGVLRDIALAGALRKGKQSERVSYATAMALAERLELEDERAILTTMRDEAQRVDEALAELLRELCGGVGVRG